MCSDYSHKHVFTIRHNVPIQSHGINLYWDEENSIICLKIIF